MTAIIIKTVEYAESIQAIQFIRQEVFQKEQGVAEELEFDGLDKTATHLLAYLDEQPVGTTRIRKIDDQTVKIERLAVLKTARRKGIGKKLMKKSIEIIIDQDYRVIVIHAQEYITSFYRQLGFEQVGNTFKEANISHIKMINKVANDDYD